MANLFMRLLFPGKCMFCTRILPWREEFICRECQSTLHPRPVSRSKIRFVKRWYALWNYQDGVRESIRRFKFHMRQNYAVGYARYLSAQLVAQGMDDVDLITWVPVSRRRRRTRGYDQSKLLAQALSDELGLPVAGLLKKTVDNQPQSGIRGVAQRRANVMGVYWPVHLEKMKGKRVLLVDDVVTTGATASECARVLLTNGADEVFLAAVATVPRIK